MTIISIDLMSPPVIVAVDPIDPPSVVLVDVSGTGMRIIYDIERYGLLDKLTRGPSIVAPEVPAARPEEAMFDTLVISLKESGRSVGEQPLPGFGTAHRPGGRYTAHQGERERQRRLRQQRNGGTNGKG